MRKRILLNGTFFLLFTEIALRLVWLNPYVPQADQVYLHQPGEHKVFHRLDALYVGAPDAVLLQTSQLGYIVNARTRNESAATQGRFAIAVGGSTTESATVQEGHRWPDLLEIPTLNYGKGRLYSYNTYLNLRHLLGQRRIAPALVFIMDGINNVSRYIARGPEAFDVATYRYTITSPVVDAVMTHSYLAALCWWAPKQRSMWTFYEGLARRNRRHAEMSQADFDAYLSAHLLSMRQALRMIYGKMDALLDAHGAVGVVLTQPDAYQAGYAPAYGTDLRVFPVVVDRRLTVAQSAQLMDHFNRLTTDVAQELGMTVIDTAACFRGRDTSALFYDACHFTPAGSRVFADCVNRALQERHLL